MATIPAGCVAGNSNTGYVCPTEDTYFCPDLIEPESGAHYMCYHVFNPRCDPKTYNGYADCTRCYDSEIDDIRNGKRLAYVIQDDCKVIFGERGDTPLVGDWRGTGKDTIGVWRKGTFYLSSTIGGAPNANDIVIQYGLATDTPVIWKHDGKDTIGVYRNGTFFLKKENAPGGADLSFDYGTTGDSPVMGDWSGIGYDTVGIYRGGAFYLRNSNDSGNGDTEILGFGKPGDIPVVGDWTGTGKIKVGVYDPETRIYTLQQDDGSTETVPFAGKWTWDYDWDKIARGECGDVWGDDGWSLMGCGMWDNMNVHETPIVGDFCGTGKDMVASVYMDRSEWIIPGRTGTPYQGSQPLYPCPTVTPPLTSGTPINTSGSLVTNCNTTNCPTSDGYACNKATDMCELIKDEPPITTSSDSSVYLYGAVALVGLGVLYFATQ